MSPSANGALSATHNEFAWKFQKVYKAVFCRRKTPRYISYGYFHNYKTELVLNRSRSLIAFHLDVHYIDFFWGNKPLRVVNSENDWQFDLCKKNSQLPFGAGRMSNTRILWHSVHEINAWANVLLFITTRFSWWQTNILPWTKTFLRCVKEEFPEMVS